ncbi:MAG: TolC family protein [Legionella sp.]|uniref:TolC family protein n=1 Tax=Legionella sp. TaxID=459 RepID=UPI0039E24800
MKAKTVLLGLMAVFVEGCSKMPPPNKGIEYPTHTRTGHQYALNKADLSTARWWKKLNNSELNQFIKQALLKNNQLKNANATISQAQAQLKAAQYDWFPTLDANIRGFNAGTWHTGLEPKGVIASHGLLTNISNLQLKGYYAGFYPSYSFNILENLNNVRAAKASLAIKQAMAQSTKLAIISQMSSSYFMLLGLKEQLILEKKLICDLKKLRQLEDIHYKKGGSDIEKTVQLDQELYQETVKIPQIENSISQIENAIHILLNENPDPIRTHHTIYLLNTNNLIPTALPSSVLKNRPDIMVALNNVNVANADLGKAYSAFFPAISLTGSAGSVSADLKKILGLTSGFWVDQALASIKVLNGNAYQNLQSTKANYYATYYNYLQTLRSAFADVDNSLMNEKKRREEYLLIQKSYIAARKRYSITFAQFKAGARDFRDVVNAQINVDRYQLIIIQEKIQLLDSIVNVFNSVAGGCNIQNFQEDGQKYTRLVLS